MGRDATARILSGLLFILAALVLAVLVEWKAVAEMDQRVLNWCVAHRTPGVTAVMEAVTALFAPWTAVAWACVVGLSVGVVSRSMRLGLYVPASMGVSAALTVCVKECVERARPPFPERLVVELSYSYPSGHTTAAAAFAVSAVILVVSCVMWMHSPAWSESQARTGASGDIEGDESGSDESVKVESAAHEGIEGAGEARASARGHVARYVVCAYGLRPLRYVFLVVVACALIVLIAATRVYLGAHWLSDVCGGACVGAGSALLLSPLLTPRLPHTSPAL